MLTPIYSINLFVLFRDLVPPPALYHKFGDDVPAADNVREPLDGVSMESDVVRIVVELPEFRRRKYNWIPLRPLLLSLWTQRARKFSKTVPL